MQRHAKNGLTWVIPGLRLVGRTGHYIGQNLGYMELSSTLWGKADGRSAIYGNGNSVSTHGKINNPNL